VLLPRWCWVMVIRSCLRAKSVQDLNGKLRAYIEGWNKRAHPFIWTKTAAQILNKANRPTTSNPRH
jgi:hypothetical protein